MKYSGIALVLLTALQPVNSYDFWFHAAVGRAVLGDVTVSPDLVGNVTAPTAYWGGTIPTCFCALLSNWLTLPSALMTGRLFCAAVLLAFVIFFKNTHTSPVMAVGLITFMCLANPALDPVPIFWEVMCALAVVRLVLAFQPSWKHLAGFCCLIACWANAGCHVAMSIAVVALVAAIRGLRLRQCLLLIAVNICAMSLAPRGFDAVADSTKFLFPALFEDARFLMGTSLAPAGVHDWPAIALCVILFSLMLWQLGADSRSRQAIVVLFIAPFAAMVALCPANIPIIASVALGVLFFNPPATVSSPKEVSSQSRAPKYAMSTFCSIVIYCFAWGSGLISSPGWGMSSAIDYRLLEPAFAPLRGVGTGICLDTRSAGMLAWIRPAEIKPQDSIETAFLNGRLPALQQLKWDLKTGRRDYYRRRDQSDGGWWRHLHNGTIATTEPTRLILFSQDDCQITHSLAPSLWKPLSIDSPVLPFARVDDQPLAKRIRDVILQLQFLSSGEWTFDSKAFENPQASLLAFFGIPNDTGRWIAQSRTLRAFRLPMAGLRILRPLLKRTSFDSERQKILNEISACHQALAHREKIDSGQSAEFRQAVIMAIEDPAQIESEIMRQAAVMYSSGKFAELDKLFANSDCESQYTRLILLMESGKLQQANELAQDFIQAYPDHPHAINAGNLFDTIRF